MRSRTLHAGTAMLAIVAAAVPIGLFARGPAVSAAEAAGGKTRTYYIAAEAVRWNYAPSGRDLITGKPFGDQENTFVKRGPDRVGSVYWKARYLLYTNGTFRHRKSQGPRWKHLGLLGPVIHAEVGDTIKVVFLNRLPFPASIHPHGVFYTKRAEGAPYADGTRGLGDIVRPRHRYTYVWKVPERAGPAEMDGSSVMWMYHGHVDEVTDTNTGLVGSLIVTKSGMARADGSPKDIGREFVNLFSVLDENQSRFLDRNVQGLSAVRNNAISPEDLEGDDDFIESNLMHSINGRVYGNLRGLGMKRGERVRWYVMDLGTEVDLHTPHWHGNTVTMNGMRSDMLQLLPGMMSVADMDPDARGTWLFHCHVNDHILAGMLALYHVN
jgi:hypothetical protein